MRWRAGPRSGNVEDRRGRRGLGMGMGIGGIVLTLIVVLLGGDPSRLFQLLGTPQEETSASSPATDEEYEFVDRVLGSTQEVWHKLFGEINRAYDEPKLVLFAGSVQSACGFASAAVGPFYCPPDQQVYLDLEFFSDLKTRFGAPGDFAQAYVIAHEVGHHVQNLLGIMDDVQAKQQRASKREANELSVRLELQADFFAGVWGHHAEKMRDILEEGDLEEALAAASAIGDDRLQAEHQGHVVPESFTHGTSAQRVRWFRRGLETGELSKGDTFSAKDL